MKSHQDKLDQEFVRILGNENVYFQPPASIKLKYPCIVYEFDTTDTKSASNNKYILTNRYSVKHIFKSLENEKKDEILTNFQMIRHDNRMIADGLYQDSFTLYY